MKQQIKASSRARAEVKAQELGVVKTSCRILRHFGVAALVAVGLSGSAWATGPIINNISPPIQYGSENTYFCYASFDTAATWDQAKTLAAAVGPYNGLSPHLALFPTEETYTWMVANIANFTSPAINDWDEAWIGGFNNGGTYEWINGGGTITTTHWDTTWNPPQPNTANYGVGWMFGSYGDVWTTFPATAGAGGALGNVIVQYGVVAVPEPAALSLLALGSLLFFRRKK